MSWVYCAYHTNTISNTPSENPYLTTHIPRRVLSSSSASSFLSEKAHQERLWRLCWVLKKLDRLQIRHFHSISSYSFPSLSYTRPSNNRILEEFYHDVHCGMLQHEVLQIRLFVSALLTSMI